MARPLALALSSQLLSSIGRIIVALAVLAAAATAGWATVAAHDPSSESNSDRELSSAPVVQLFTGWNHVSYMGLTLSLPDALTDVRAHVTMVWQYVAATQEWRSWREGLPTRATSLIQLERGSVYFVHSTQDGLWTQPFAPPLSSPEPESLPATWEVLFSRSMAALGLAQTMQFDATGTGTIGQAGGTEQAFTVDSTALATVDRLMRDNDFYRRWPASAVTGCGGCSLWEITIRNPSGGRVILQADDFGLSGALHALVEQLSAILLAAVRW